MKGKAKRVMLKQKIKNREKIIGMHVNLCDVGVAKIAGLAGYDFIWVDMEHSYLSFETLLGHIIAIQATGTPVIVRAPQDDLTATKKILEMGVDGIIFPMINTAEEAERLIAMTLYPPYGARGFGPMNAVDYGFRNVREYTTNNHKDMCRFVQIEHKIAVENLNEIIENPYIDGYIIGPFDLSGSYDRLCDVFSEEITGTIESVVKKLHKAGKYVGLSTGDNRDTTLTHWHELGIDMLSAGTDYEFLREMAIDNRKRLEMIHKCTNQ